jgi:hypothetical protein
MPNLRHVSVYPQWLAISSALAGKISSYQPKILKDSLSLVARDFSKPTPASCCVIGRSRLETTKTINSGKTPSDSSLAHPHSKDTTSRHVLESRPSDSEALNAAILWTGNYPWRYEGFSCKPKNLCAIFSPDVKRRMHSIRHLAVKFSCSFTIKNIRLLIIHSVHTRLSSTPDPRPPCHHFTSCALQHIHIFILRFMINSYMFHFLRSFYTDRFAMPPPSLLQLK